ncbi:hypothetical protein [uncultured Ruminococcus sp.]|uniref:hypothetical protein n=1 Tax=uncultured Ruminococcus sp. TaxID=165186 RepID=UPI00266C4FB1|nr:hypothetical protein [uncultured Ruminococcus sp.]
MHKKKSQAAGGGSARRPAEMATADLLKDSKPPPTLRPNFNCKKGSVTAGGGSPPTLRPNFKSKKSSVTADKPPVHPAGGFLLVRIYGDSFLYNLRVILESYSTSGTRTLFFFCFFFSFQQRKKEA